MIFKALLMLVLAPVKPASLPFRQSADWLYWASARDSRILRWLPNNIHAATVEPIKSDLPTKLDTEEVITEIRYE